MPIYEYRCEACGHQEEFLQRVSELPLTECPVCHKQTFSKLLSAAGFHLKGSGWYATDFKNKTTKPAEKKAEDKSEAKTETKTDTKTETKPEKKTEKKTESKSEAAA
jgi:putative FmdB family regulatory protein